MIPSDDPDRFTGIRRDFTEAEVARLAGSFRIRHTLAEQGARRLWHLLRTEPYAHTLGALTGNQAMQQVKAGLRAIYLSGWQVAADADLAGEMYPDQSLYPANSMRAWCVASTTRCAAPTRSPASRAMSGSTGWRRSSATPGAASAGR